MKTAIRRYQLLKAPMDECSLGATPVAASIKFSKRSDLRPATYTQQTGMEPGRHKETPLPSTPMRTKAV
jgi:hypothetical protein